MDLQGRLDQDLKTAMLARDELRLAVLRSLKSALTYASVDAKTKGGAGELTDEQALAVLAKEAKKRQDSADAFASGGASERAEKELTEKAIIEKYLPRQLDERELATLVDQTIRELGASDVKDLGRVIGGVKAKAGTSADGAKLAQIARERLK